MFINTTELYYAEVYSSGIASEYEDFEQEKTEHTFAYVFPTATRIPAATRTGSRSRNFKRKCKFIQRLHNQR